MADTEKSFGDKLLSFFIKEAPGESTPGASTPGASKPGASAPVPASVPAGMQPGTNTLPTAPSTPTPTAAGAIDTKFIDHFAGVLSKTNLQGPDYFEFREILRNLSNLGLSEEKQFQAAWASFKAMAGTGDPAALGSTANQYLAALSADRDAFLKSVEAAVQERVGGLQTEQQKLQSDNEAIAKQLAELQQRVDSNNERLSKIGGEISEQSSRINQNRASFEATYVSFTDQIKADVQKMATYLK